MDEKKKEVERLDIEGLLDDIWEEEKRDHPYTACEDMFSTFATGLQDEGYTRRKFDVEKLEESIKRMRDLLEINEEDKEYSIIKKAMYDIARDILQRVLNKIKEIEEPC